MNLVQQAEQLKNVPDQMLGQMQQNPTAIPPYLVLAEMERREAMRKGMHAQGDPVQQKTVADEMRERFNPTAPQMPPGMQPGQPGMPQGGMPPGQPPMRMAEGGLASLKGYFDQMSGENPLPQVDPSMLGPMQFPGAPPMGSFDDEPAMNMTQLDTRYGKPPAIEDVMAQVRGLRGKSRLEAIAETLAQQEQGYRDKKPKLGQILMELGLGMAASKRPDFAGAIGEGGLNALQSYTRQREGNLTRADNAMRQRLGLAEAMQSSDDVATREAGELHRANVAGRNTAIMTGENARRGMQADKSRTATADADREARAVIEGMKESAAERRYRETFSQTTSEKQKDRDARMAELEREITGGKYRDHSAASGGDKLSPILGFSKSMLNDIESEILHLRPMLDSAMPGEKKTITDRLDALRSKKDYWRKVQMQEIKRTMPNVDMSAFDEPKELTIEEALAMGKPRAAAAPPAVDRSELKKKAGIGMMNSLPGLTSILDFISKPNR